MAYVYNDGGSSSYGLYQYKKATWYAYIERYKLFPDAEPAELMNLIWDRYSQELVTRTILTNEPQSWRLWYNCLKYRIYPLTTSKL